ncbi:hypothetical protein JAAARDRAFT_56619 [Jaapia argillacea MUCL 33604]|uniref:Uncharacterized protein n=1 Tax=Jaapia argillacea MUCL 33604 TaxID=933084 RepID=A0A067Q0C7_9AGAM|nr:hypothetical protein JAAARDRAFT_56619 [Jaapia argillacea MUCL 33604]
MKLFDLPQELWDEIFTFACTDGGFTGCSLSLVSQYIRNVSEPTRLHSIFLRTSIHRLSNMEVLVQMLERRQPGHFHTRHLFVEFAGDLPTSDLASVLVDVESQATSPAEDPPGFPRTTITKEALVDLNRLLSRVLRAISPTLVGLTLYLGANLPLSNITTFLPRLEELTVHAQADNNEDDTPLISQQSSFVPFEFAKRIHIACPDRPFSRIFNKYIMTASTSCPHLTHLRISGLRKSFKAIDVATAIGVHAPRLDPTPETDSRIPSFPPSLHTLVIQRSPNPALYRRHEDAENRITGYIQDVMYQADLLTWHTMTWNPHPKLIVVKARECLDEGTTYSLEDAKDEWLDRVGGGVGCWVDETTFLGLP